MRKKNDKRIKLLSEGEITDLYGLPHFTEHERIHYFSLNQLEKTALNKFAYIHSKVHFILQLGYFKAKRRLFNFKFQEVPHDVAYVMQTYFTSLDMPRKSPSRNAIAKNNKKILAAMDYHNQPRKAAGIMAEKAKQLMRSLNKPIVILRELFLLLEQEKLVFPEYSTVQTIIGHAIIAEEKRLAVCVKNSVPDESVEVLDALLKVDDLAYAITTLKKSPKSFGYKQIQQEISQHKKYYSLYKLAKTLLPKLGLSRQSISYYASLVDHYNAQALGRFPIEKSRLYLLCYLYSRFQKMHDQLIETFLHYVDKYTQEAKAHAKIMVAEANKDATKNFHKASQLIDMFVDEELALTVFGDLQGKATATILSENQIKLVSQYMKNGHVDYLKYEWEYHAENYQCVIKNLRSIFMVMPLETRGKDKHLLKNAAFMKSLFESGKSLNNITRSQFPMSRISSRIKPYLYEIKEIKRNNKIKLIKVVNPYKYEFSVYQRIAALIYAERIYANDTTAYKSFESDLGVKNFNKDKKKILAQIDSPKLNAPIKDTLDELEKKLDDLTIRVNKRIASGDNKHVKIKKEGNEIIWTLPYPKKTEEINNPFYNQIPPIHINNLVDFVDQRCHFMDAFTHIKPHQSKSQADKLCIKGAIIANASNLGTYSMSGSCDLDYQSLLQAEKNYIRLETLRGASDCISDAMADLPIFKHYNLGDFAHGSADAQKYRTKRETFNSRHSSKYYGTDKGVAPYSLIFNHVPINVKMIGAHEYEGNHLYDILFGNNNANITLDRISTDTAGTNNVNFVLLDTRFVEYTPCYKTIRSKAKLICSLKDVTNYKNFLIKPSKKANRKLIEDEWPNLQPIFAALMLKETSQSAIVKKLSAHDRKSKTKDALWEYNNILMSIYLLRYIDDPELRQYVRAALNRGEAYHQLRRIIAETNGRDFRGGSDLEIEIWNECGRLLANAIIFYNATLLSELMVLKEQQGDFEAAEFIRKLSPVAIQHIKRSGPDPGKKKKG
jgi:TnpA family transposase